MTTPTPQPGWHPDPEGKPQLRWWDGQQWTAATQPLPAHPGPVTQPPNGFDPRTNEGSNPTFSARPYPDPARNMSRDIGFCPRADTKPGSGALFVKVFGVSPRRADLRRVRIVGV
ncbi:DUF2510 domain-containing protein [Rhodococcus wratislaviensis]|uniref:DUF2510 domain-containing protein n=1 Tax=Rhodococcus wratislaviensis TaxID=44752 RepID=UPI000F569859|nr:DUF2510 domain-containing protein [Rhodococcus wratislaviensis]